MEAKHRKSKVCGRGNVAMLKVSFFGPLLWGYNVAIDKEYKYALVAGGA
jgi:apolipoprotein D and lipocalin family protein